jgi:hypothetical protein
LIRKKHWIAHRDFATQPNIVALFGRKIDSPSPIINNYIIRETMSFFTNQHIRTSLSDLGY